MFQFDGRFHQGSILYVNVSWCGYCREARPILEKVSDHFGHALPVYDVDGDRWKSYLQTKLGANAPSKFPTILFIGRDGSVSRFEDERDVDTLVAWACTQASTQRGTIAACESV
jgi:thiol-disulfide isomerase/thioredoxin